jgi:hypothetical protein
MDGCVGYYQPDEQRKGSSTQQAAAAKMKAMERSWRERRSKALLNREMSATGNGTRQYQYRVLY